MNGEGLEASALSFAPPKPNQYASGSVLVGFWSTREVKKLLLPSLDSDKALSLSFFQVPKSVVMHDFGLDATRPRLQILVGFADGTSRSFEIREGKLHEKKVESLGDTPVSLTRCSVDGRSAILGVSSRTSLFFWENDSLCRSPVLVKASPSPLK